MICLASFIIRLLGATRNSWTPLHDSRLYFVQQIYITSTSNTNSITSSSFSSSLTVAQMALSRLCLRNPLLRLNLSLQQPLQPVAALFGAPPSLSYSSATAEEHGGAEKDGDKKEIAVSEGSSSRQREGRRGLLPWGNPLNRLPFHLGNGIGHALLDASGNLHNLLENLKPSRWLGQSKQDDKSYKLRYEVPGLSKEDLKITVEDRFLVISGERKEEEGDDDEGWYSSNLYYNTSVLLPEDAEVEGIKAEVKDGVLKVTIPRSEEKKRGVKEVLIE